MLPSFAFNLTPHCNERGVHFSERMLQPVFRFRKATIIIWHFSSLEHRVHGFRAIMKGRGKEERKEISVPHLFLPSLELLLCMLNCCNCLSRHCCLCSNNFHWLPFHALPFLSYLRLLVTFAVITTRTCLLMEGHHFSTLLARFCETTAVLAALTTPLHMVLWLIQC